MSGRALLRRAARPEPEARAARRVREGRLRSETVEGFPLFKGGEARAKASAADTGARPEPKASAAPLGVRS